LLRNEFLPFFKFTPSIRINQGHAYNSLYKITAKWGFEHESLYNRVVFI